MKWLTGAALIAAVLGVALALGASLLRLDDYIPLLEEELAARLQRPVSIDAADAGVFPLPHVTLDGLVIGDAYEIKVGKATLQPDLWSLFAAEKVIRSIEFKDVTFAREAVGAIAALMEANRGASGISIENVRLRSAVVKLERAPFGPFDADVRVSRADAPGELRLRTHDGALVGRLAARNERFELEIEAKDWTLPFGPPLRVQALQTKGTLSAAGLELPAIEARLYGGTAKGELKAQWTRGVSMEGRFELQGVELAEAAALISPKLRVSGKLDAKPTLSAAATGLQGLPEALKLETPFAIHGGLLHGVDLAGAAALLEPGSAEGQTRFGELAGRLSFDRGAYRFTQLRVSSGSLSARGHVTIAPTKMLSGRIETHVKGITGPTGIPLVLAGTLDAPSVYPTRDAFAR